MLLDPVEFAYTFVVFAHMFLEGAVRPTSDKRGLMIMVI
jgi:hypothetical protein